MMFPPGAHSLQVMTWIQSQHLRCFTKAVWGFAQAIQTTCNAEEKLETYSGSSVKFTQ